MVKGTNEIAPLTPFHDLDSWASCRNVPTLNFHPHLPHYELTEGGGDPSRCWRGSRSTSNVRTLSPRRAIGSSTAFSGCRRTSRGRETSFWSNSTNFTTLFGGDEEPRELLEESRGDEVSARIVARAPIKRCAIVLLTMVCATLCAGAADLPSTRESAAIGSRNQLLCQSMELVERLDLQLSAHLRGFHPLRHTGRGLRLRYGGRRFRQVV